MLDIHLRGEEGSTELVTFSLAGDVYGLPVEYMLEVNRGLHWTKIPGAPEFVLGAANLRGQIVTIVDLRPILDYEENLEDRPACVLIVTSQGEIVGILVDRIDDVVVVGNKNLERPPSNLPSKRREQIAAVTKTEHGLVAVIDPKSILNQGYGHERRDA